MARTCNIRRNDTVVVISGSHEGKRGKVLQVLPRKDRVVVRGVNLVERHVRPSQQDRRGERIRKEAPLSLSDVVLLDPRTGQPSRTFEAVHLHARISPRKVRLVTALIRGRDANDALDLLQFTKKRACVFVDRVLRSAIANADEKEANVSELMISESRVDEGPVIPRWRPKDRGRAHPIRKPTCHIIVAVKVR